MKKFIFILCLFVSGIASAQDKLKVGDVLDNIVLKSTEDKLYNFNEQKHVKGFVMVFMANSCDYCIMYKERIIALDEKYKNLGYPVIGVSPFGDNAEKYPLDAMPEMKKWVQEKQIKFPYLSDENFKYTHLFGLKYTPEVVILQKQNNGYQIKYIGRIDDNPSLKKKNTNKIVENILDKLLNFTSN